LSDELGRPLGTLVAPARAEPNNINYDLHARTTIQMFGFFMRTGRPPSDLAAHFELPYMKAFLAVLPEVLEGEMDLRHCSMVTKIAETV
jgi:quinol monooxygenase YgiN